MKKRGHRGSCVLIVGLLLASSACAYGTGTARDTRQAHDPGGAVQLNITNHNNGPMEVYAAGSGTSYRMGTVYPGLAGRFVVRPGMITNGPVEFLARSGNSGPLFRSGQLLLSPGAIVDFEIANNPLNSIAAVRAWVTTPVGSP
jgi:hypothetical protein